MTKVHYNNAGTFHYHIDGDIKWVQYNKREPAEPQIREALDKLGIDNYTLENTTTL